MRTTQSGALPPPRAQYHPYDESAGRCIPPASSISVGFTPGGRVPAAAGGVAGSVVTVVDSSHSPRNGGGGTAAGGGVGVLGTSGGGGPVSPRQKAGTVTVMTSGSKRQITKDVSANNLTSSSLNSSHYNTNNRDGGAFSPMPAARGARKGVGKCSALYDYDAQSDQELRWV